MWLSRWNGRRPHLQLPRCTAPCPYTDAYTQPSFFGVDHCEGVRGRRRWDVGWVAGGAGRDMKMLLALDWEEHTTTAEH